MKLLDAFTMEFETVIPAGKVFPAGKVLAGVVTVVEVPPIIVERTLPLPVLIFKVLFFASSKVIFPVPTVKITFAPLTVAFEILPLVMCKVSLELKPLIVSLPSPLAY